MPAIILEYVHFFAADTGALEFESGFKAK